MKEKKISETRKKLVMKDKEVFNHTHIFMNGKEYVANVTHYNESGFNNNPFTSGQIDLKISGEGSDIIKSLYFEYGMNKSFIIGFLGKDYRLDYTTLAYTEFYTNITAYCLRKIN